MESVPRCDRELITAVIEGETDAFTELYDRHASYVHSVIRNILHTADSEDICQETFIKVFTYLHKFDGRAKFRTWITRIAMNECFMVMRKWKQPSNGDSYLLPLDTDHDLPLEDRELRMVADRIDLARLMRRIKPLPRRVITLHLVGYSDAVVADMTGLTVGSVKMHLHWSKARMRNWYDPSHNRIAVGNYGRNVHPGAHDDLEPGRREREARGLRCCGMP